MVFSYNKTLAPYLRVAASFMSAPPLAGEISPPYARNNFYLLSQPLPYFAAETVKICVDKTGRREITLNQLQLNGRFW